ncbi:MAG: hypothetical protein ACREQN_02485 [Candidatus Binataceae bacterium]
MASFDGNACGISVVVGGILLACEPTDGAVSDPGVIGTTTVSLFESAVDSEAGPAEAAAPDEPAPRVADDVEAGAGANGAAVDAPAVAVAALDDKPVVDSVVTLAAGLRAV